MRGFLIFGILAFVGLVNGCAISNQGMVDYRYQRPGSQSLEPINISQEEAKNAIREGDPLVLSLKYVYLKDFTEFRSPLRLVRMEPANGEIAVVTKVCEAPCQRTQGPDAISEARVIYYGDDVWKGQPLNLRNLESLYGPITYKGNTLRLDVYIVELDMPGAQLRQLTKTLASLGTTFYPPAHPVTPILSTLADTFIQDDQDDNVFSFSFDLKARVDSGSGKLNPATGVLESGNYILVRLQDRTKSINWQNLRFDEKNGQVINLSGSCTFNAADKSFHGCEEYREGSYVVIEVAVAKSALAADVQQVLYKDLQGKLAAEGVPGALAGINKDALTEIQTSLASLGARDAAIQAIRGLENSKPGDVQRKSSTVSFASLWFDSSKKFEDADKGIVVRRMTSFLGACSNLSSSEAIGLSKAVTERDQAKSDAVVSALENCTKPS